jgi:CTP synthase (UTP-ammonia lyase)
VRKLAVIGDYNPAKATHLATNAALGHVADPLPVEWIATDKIAADVEAQLGDFAGLFISPSSPYRDMDGALRVIRFARSRGVPLFGT